MKQNHFWLLNLFKSSLEIVKAVHNEPTNNGQVMPRRVFHSVVDPSSRHSLAFQPARSECI